MQAQQRAARLAIQSTQAGYRTTRLSGDSGQMGCDGIRFEVAQKVGEATQERQ
jgi:hypothetical protein